MANANDTPPAKTKLFTPVDHRTGERLELQIDAAIDLPYGRTWSRVVRDLTSGKLYRVWTKACGLRCKCDASAEEVLEPESGELPQLLAEWCDCGVVPDDPAYLPDGVCPCGVWKEHYHCPDCKCIFQVD
jgi:hypothetical protein